jgi:predicted RNase H-like HicB family nuclease
MKLKVVLESAEEGGFTVYVPSLPGCVSEGETEEEALKNIREAIELYLEQWMTISPSTVKRSEKSFCERTSLDEDVWS